MSATALAALFTAAAGIAAALQVAINGRLGGRIGTLEAATFQTVVALVLFVVVTAALRGGLGGVASGLRQPAWMWLGGVMGFVIISALTYAPPRIGNLTFAAILIALQLTVATLIDAFGLFGFERLGLSAHRLGGLVLLAAGTALVLKR
ncbi:MAG: DMT family transporter [Gaiellales bacterium]